MKVYLASRWSNQEAMRQVAAWLEARGHTVTSRWLTAERDADPMPEFFRAHGKERANEDLEDVLRADVLILDTAGGLGRRAGYMVEYGYALGNSRKTVVVGPAECVFTQLADMQYVNWPTFYAALDGNNYEFPFLHLDNRLLDRQADDPVDHPAHYTHGKIEVWHAISDWKLDFLLGNVVKYVARAAHKNAFLEDLKKARAYLNEKIRQVESEITR